MKHYLVLAIATSIPVLAQPATDSGVPLSGGAISALVEPSADSTEALENAANVNSRYTVESVGLAPNRYRVSPALADDMKNLVGVRFDNEALQILAERISSELRGYPVTFKLTRGSDRGLVRVEFTVQAPKLGLEVEFPKLTYTTPRGASGESDLILDAGANTFTFGLLADRDSWVERASGVRGRYDRWNAGSDRVHLSLEIDSFHDQYDTATRSAALISGQSGALYRSRTNIEPAATVVLAGPLTWTFGVSFEQVQPDLPAAKAESANAIVNTLRFDRRWPDSGSGSHRFSAGYTLRAATSFLGSAYAYTRHVIDATYHWKRGRQQAEASFEAGAISGQAPLFERFVLGTGVTLRGWNQYDLDPLGGGRVVYGSLGYGYRMLRVFYDAGAVWDKAKSIPARQSLGFGVKLEGVLIAVAFPLRADRVEPVLIAGMNF